MHTLDRSVLRVLLRNDSPSQAQIAQKIGVPVEPVRKALLRLKKDGLVELPSGRCKPPILAISSALRRLEDEIKSLALKLAGAA